MFLTTVDTLQSERLQGIGVNGHSTNAQSCLPPHPDAAHG